MLGRSKIFMTALILILLAALLAGPPVAFAGKLQTACNPFLNKSIQKNGPCGTPGAISPDDPQNGQDSLVFELDCGGDDSLLLVGFPSQSILASLFISFYSVPLRC